MTYRIRVEHTSHYQYATSVQYSYNEVRVTPLSTPRQLVLDSRLAVSPGVPMHGYIDYWGTVVQAFDLQEPHDEMVIRGGAVVETDAFCPSSPDPGWAEVTTPEVRARFSEYLAPTGQVPHDPRLDNVAAEMTAGLASGGAAAADAAGAAVRWVREQLRYVPGATAVHTSAVEAWNGGEGVCQDFAHLTLALMRAMGLPARYCSGYVLPTDDTEVGQTVQGESHAWVEYWAGDWTPADPTSGRDVGSSHVLVARGRDYSDVPPVKGIFHGGPTSRLDVTVALTRLA